MKIIMKKMKVNSECPQMSNLDFNDSMLNDDFVLIHWNRDGMLLNFKITRDKMKSIA